MDQQDLNIGVGRLLAGARRVFFEFKGEQDRSRGPLELSFDDGGVIVMDAGGDGESLAVQHHEWVDPFAEPLSEENEAYVKRYGKWSVVDVSGQQPIAGIIRKRVDEIRPILNEQGRITGAVFSIGGRQLVVNVIADDLYIDFL